MTKHSNRKLNQEHSNGHILPIGANTQKVYFRFVSSYIQRYLTCRCGSPHHLCVDEINFFMGFLAEIEKFCNDIRDQLQLHSAMEVQYHSTILKQSLSLPYNTKKETNKFIRKLYFRR